MIRINPRTLDAEIVRYDTGSFAVKPKLNGEYMLVDGCTLYFTLRKQKNGPVLLQKTATEFEDGIGTIPINSIDTENLKPGNYIYDLVVIRQDGTRDSLIPGNRDDAYFVIKRGVKQGQ